MHNYRRTLGRFAFLFGLAGLAHSGGIEPIRLEPMAKPKKTPLTPKQKERRKKAKLARKARKKQYRLSK